MPLEAPNLDDRSFDEIKALARERIARYAPEWTDFNEADPGMTLVELFAWLTEMMLHQMNKLPEVNYIKFLKLLGLELNPPIPAEAHLTFKVQNGATPQPVLKGSQIAAQSAETGELMIFETEAGLDLIKYPMAEVQVFDGNAFTVLTTANAVQGTGFRPLGFVPQVGAALYLGFTPAETTPAAGERIFPRQLRFRVFLPTEALAGEAQSCKEAVDPPAPPVTLVWEYRHPNAPTRWQRLAVFEDDSTAFSREGYLLIEGPSECLATVEGKLTETPLYWLRCRIESGAYPVGQTPEIDFIRANTVNVHQLSTIRGELLGESEGVPEQIFKLRYRPVFRDSVSLQVESEGREPEQWLRVDDFLSSDADDPHYVLNATAGEIHFGDGRRGRIPVAGSDIVLNEYRYGGGTEGNVAANQISIPLTSLTGVESVTNLRPAVGGHDEQKLDDLKELAPKILRHQNRAVTGADFAALAKDAGGVAKAVAISKAHPSHPGIEVPGAVTVVIVPDMGERPQKPSGDLIRHVCKQLDQHRLITTELYVKGPEYFEISVEAKIIVKPYVSFDAVANEVEKQLNARLDPLSWPFGQDLRPTSLYEVILSVEGVMSVPYLNIFVQGIPHESLSKPVLMPADGLVYATKHMITVEPGTDN